MNPRETGVAECFGTRASDPGRDAKLSYENIREKREQGETDHGEYGQYHGGLANLLFH